MVSFWGIHNDQPSIDPVEDRAVRIGWDDIGDLSKVPATRDGFKELIRSLGAPDEQVASSAGTLYRFAHELAEGDIVVSPVRARRTLNIGRVTGPYEFHPGVVHPHWRSVDWLLTEAPRDVLSVAAQDELSAATTLFKITTGREEIEQLLDDPPQSESADFSWVPFYEDLTSKLLTYHHRRDALLEQVRTVASTSGREHLFKYLRNDVASDGSRFQLADVDPFTVIGTFNRGIHVHAKLDIANAFKEVFEIKAPAPTGFDGIPILNNMNSWFFRLSREREEHEIEALWQLCQSIVDYADQANEDSREALVSAFDACSRGRTGKLTMGAFWTRPNTFVAFDSLNVGFLRGHFPDVAAQLALRPKLTGDEFLSNTETLATWIRSGDSEFDTFPALSYAAFGAATKPRPLPGPTDELVDPTVSPPTTDQTEDTTYDLAAIREDGAFVLEADLKPMLERLRAKKNIILQGPPGTGKTWLARRLGWALCGRRQCERVEVVQFHPSLAYEDFVRGWRPTQGGSLDLVDGPFVELCESARKNPDRDYVLVIEEINRGNPAQIFGELLTLIEADKHDAAYGMRLAYPRADESFFVPPNVHIIGTMNLADRSLAIVDMALRRRFAFIELEPAFGDDWEQHVSGLGYDLDLLTTYGERLRALNVQIADDAALGRQYRVGHSFFTPAVTLEDTGLTTQEWWRRIVDTDVRPLLEEYWFDRPQLAERACADLLGG